MMKMNLTKLVALICAASIAIPAHAEIKLGAVDLKKVFEGYWRTKQADKQIKDRKADYDRVLANLEEDYKKSSEELKKLVDASNDQAVSSTERDKRKADVEKKVTEIREQENGIRNYRDQAISQLQDQMKRLRESVLREIQATVDEKSKAAGFQLVVDTAAVSGNATPVFLFNTLSGGDIDISEAVLKTLNANAPADAFKTDEKEEKKDEKKDKK
jgi:outer membrane protein